MSNNEWLEAELARLDRQRAEVRREPNNDPWLIACAAELAILAVVIFHLPEIITALR